MSLHLDVLIPPTVEPVTLQQVYDHLRINPEGAPHHQDDMLEGLIATSRMDVESYTNRAFMEQTLRLTGQYEIWRDCSCCTGILLPRHPIISIESVSYYDSANASQTVDEDNYYLTADGYLRFITGYSYPALYGRTDAIRIDYVAGYGVTSSPPAYVPHPFKQAILIGVELLYAPLTPEEREAMKNAQHALLNPYRLGMGV